MDGVYTVQIYYQVYGRLECTLYRYYYQVYGKDGVYRSAHRIIIGRLSHLLTSVLKLNHDEEDLALILPG